mgnify:CR=1 FL=1
MASGMGPKQPPYSTILRIDYQIRDFSVPDAWISLPEGSPDLSASSDIHLYRWFVLASKETSEFHHPNTLIIDLPNGSSHELASGLLCQGTSGYNSS